MKCNFHTHTNYCDGNDTPEQLIKEALNRGFTSLGFSGHSYNEPDADFSMTKGADDYIKEIILLKEKYKDKINIYCGVEQDYFSTEPTEKFDYIIGSVHYIKKNNTLVAVDDTPSIIKKAVDELYNGCFDNMAEDYFMLVSDIINKTNADIIGHFDVVSKFSELFGWGESTRYLFAAEEAIKNLINYNIPFEINTGSMAKGQKSIPYPSPSILSIIKKYNGNIIITSDCHNRMFLDYKFDEMKKLAREIGFKDQAVITSSGIKYIPLFEKNI